MSTERLSYRDVELAHIDEENDKVHRGVIKDGDQYPFYKSLRQVNRWYKASYPTSELGQLQAFIPINVNDGSYKIWNKYGFTTVAETIDNIALLRRDPDPSISEYLRPIDESLFLYLQAGFYYLPTILTTPFFSQGHVGSGNHRTLGAYLLGKEGRLDKLNIYLGEISAFRAFIYSTYFFMRANGLSLSERKTIFKARLQSYPMNRQILANAKISKINPF